MTRPAGFTLLELLVVLVILGLLASVTAPAVAGAAPAISLRFFSAVPLDAITLDFARQVIE